MTIVNYEFHVSMVLFDGFSSGTAVDLSPFLLRAQLKWMMHINAQVPDSGSLS